MPPVALALLITAAALHTSWNLLVKRAREKQIFTWWAMVVGTALFAPLLAFSAPLPDSIWPYVLASALVEMIYYLALLRAYSIGDFSLVYPLARGAAPAFLALWAALFLGERPSAGGLAGLTLLLIGLLLVGGAARRGALRQAAVAPDLALSAGGAAAQTRRGWATAPPASSSSAEASESWRRTARRAAPPTSSSPASSSARPATPAPLGRSPRNNAAHSARNAGAAPRASG